jgi:hypothetical protein
MKRHSVMISNGSDTTVRVEISATASGYEVDASTTVHGMTKARHLGVYGKRVEAVASAKTEAARVTDALLTGVAP